jgi:uncharacterized membrane protein (DUF485 family)
VSDFPPRPDLAAPYAAPAPPPQHPSEEPEFHALRRAQYRFGFRATVLSVSSFLLYVLLSGFAPVVMNLTLAGRMTLGLALGLAQFAVMGVTAWRYVRHMRTRVDPAARALARGRHTPAPSPGAGVPPRATGPAPARAPKGGRTW